MPDDRNHTVSETFVLTAKGREACRDKEECKCVLSVLGFQLICRACGTMYGNLRLEEALTKRTVLAFRKTARD